MLQCRTAVLAFALASAATAGTSKVEHVCNFRAKNTQLIFRVATGGCTQAEDFKLHKEVNPKAAGTVNLTLVRLKPDRCKGYFPKGTKITFDRRKLGIPASAKIELENPQRAISQHGFCRR